MAAAEPEKWLENREQQDEEVMSLEAIYATELDIISRPDDETGATYTLKIDIPLHLPGPSIRVDVWAPYEYDVANCQQMAAAVPSPTKPAFNRTESGRRWHSSFEVSHLTPLCLIVTLPQSYPSDGPPEFSLSSAWLDYLQLSVLCRQLDELWKENEGENVLYFWVDWLQNNTLSHLAIEENVCLTPYLEGMDGGLETRDPRALPDCAELQHTVLNILQHNYAAELGAFHASTQGCSICLDEKPGSQFYRINGCRHHFCRQCMAAHCEGHVAAGTVQQLMCPDGSCDVGIPVCVLRQVLGEEAYGRWERLVLQKGLESMGDVVYCPRCQMPVIQSGDDLGFCNLCQYSFCVRCRDGWHAGEPCSDILMKLAKLAEKEKKAAAAGAKPKVNQQALHQEMLNIKLVRSISKPCPGCKQDIQKADGCNKVTCSLCGQGMCWLCGRAINSYSHFSETGECTIQGLTTVHRRPERKQHEGDVALKQKLKEDPAARQFVLRCPRCHQGNLKEQRNNHLRCWCCKTHFCYQCKRAIIGPIMGHYTANMPCDQHGD